jgi:hypothetical protein
MIDFHTAKMRGHRRNIARYCRLLATELEVGELSSGM